MYLSKIWFFLVAAVAAVALTLALVMPRPAERASINDEGRRLAGACTIVRILMRDNARSRVQLADKLSRIGSPSNQPTLRLDSILFDASKGELISTKENQTGRAALNNIIASFEKAGSSPPDFILLLDTRGRVVARSSKNPANGSNDDFGDSLRGYHLVDDALAGYIRDDLWTLSGELFRVAAAPVVTRDRNWAGAIIIGHTINSDFARSLASGLDVSLSFYAAGDSVAASDVAPIHKSVLAKSSSLNELEPGTDCREGKPFTTEISGKTYTALSARLPGEAGQLGGFYTVYLERASSLGFSGTLSALNKSDLSPANFPWIRVGLFFVLLVGVGLFLMVWESDRPLRRLADDAQQLAKGGDKLNENQHRTKFGSIARSVNIALDRLRREAKSAQKDLDDLLGPAPHQGGGSPLPVSGPVPGIEPPPPPPPSQFRFSDNESGMEPAKLPTSPAPPPNLDLPIPPPPEPVASIPQQPPADKRVPPRPVVLPGAPPVVAPIDAQTSSKREGEPEMVESMPTLVSEKSQMIADQDSEARHYREIFEKFLATKRECGESVGNLTYERFVTKLRKNRAALVARHGCKSVRFQVYVKGGKAALKASPVR